MLPPNYVYATLQGYYPRLLGKDGWREALYLPKTAGVYTVTLQLYTDKGQLVDILGPIPFDQAGTIEWEDGATTTVEVKEGSTANTMDVGFPADSLARPRRGVARLSLIAGGQTYFVYPFEVVVG